MKKIIALILSMTFTLALVGCGSQAIEPIKTIEGNIATYYAMSDDTWQFDGNTYKYRLEISGRMPNAAKDSTFVYLSNLENITFEQAWKASGFSSISTDYFSKEDAVLVELK